MESAAAENDKKKKKRNLELKNKMKNMSKEAIQAAITRKKECNARAMEIVEQLIEPDVEEIWLLENLKHINQSHFQDVIEERAITRYCGYPLCSGKLLNVPKKIYKISTRENKVYDITDRKNYCSNVCYKAGVFLKDQLYTSPLWLRDCEIPVDYQILSKSVIRDGSVGSEIDLGITSPVKPEIHNLIENSKMDNNKTQGFENHSIFSEDEQKDNLKNKTGNKNELLKNYLEENIDTDGNKPIAISESVVETKDFPKRSNQKSEVLCKNEKHKSNAKEVAEVNVIVEIEKKIKSWFTMDTLLFLLGEHRLSELLKENGLKTEIPKNTEDFFIYERYQQIYKKLNLFELREKDKLTPTKPVPDYEALRQDTMDLELKVKSFYKGDSKVSFVEDICENMENSENDRAVMLPLIDTHSITSTRRRILLDKLIKVMPDMLSALELSQFRIGKEVQELIATFDLGPSNIILRPVEATLVSVVIIKLLTIQNEILNYAYTKDVTQKRLFTFLLTYDLDGGYLDRLTSYLIDVDLISKNTSF